MTRRRLSAVAKISSLVADALYTGELCESVLEPLHSIVAYDAVFLAARDRFTGTHIPMHVNGYNSSQLTFLSEDYQECFSYRAAVLNGSAMRMQDYGARFYDTPVYRHHLEPAGYREGVTLALQSGNERSVGLLTMSFRNPLETNEEARHALTLVAPILGRLVDTWSTGLVYEFAAAQQSTYLVDRQGAIVEVGQPCGTSAKARELGV
ncbi:MAG TPA: hypothetical protein VIG82_09140 [Enteractinococcus sp.]